MSIFTLNVRFSMTMRNTEAKQVAFFLSILHSSNAGGHAIDHDSNQIFDGFQLVNDWRDLDSELKSNVIARYERIRTS